MFSAVSCFELPHPWVVAAQVVAGNGVGRRKEAGERREAPPYETNERLSQSTERLGYPGYIVL